MSDEAQQDDELVDDVGRRMPPMSADEADTLLGFLDYQRRTFEWKTRDLTSNQLRQTLTHPGTHDPGGHDETPRAR